MVAKGFARLAAWRPTWSGTKRVFSKAFSLTRLIGLVLLAGFIALNVADPYPVEFMRMKVFDMYQRFHPREFMPVEKQPVTIIDIDENSLKEVGQFPWPRNTVQAMVQNLFAFGARVVAFDIVFAEPDGKSPEALIKYRPDLKPEVAAELGKMTPNDQILADFIKAARIPKKIRGGKTEYIGAVVLGQSVFFGESEAEMDRDPPDPGSTAERGLAKGALKAYQTLPGFAGLVRNIEILDKAALSRGLFSLDTELDGVVRRIPTYFTRKDEASGKYKYFPTLAVEMLRVYNQQKTVQISTNIDGISSIRMREVPKGILEIQTDGRGRVWPYFTKSDTAKYVSARDVLAGTVDPSRIKGKMAIIGTSAVGLKDIRAVPTEARIPGVEVHAQIIEAALSNQLLKRPQVMRVVELALILGAGLLMIALVPWIGAKWTIGLFFTIAAGTAYSSWYYFTQHLILFDASYVIIATLIIYTQLTYMGYASEEANRKRVKEQFSHYVSPALVNQLMEDPKAAETRKEELTIGFCDIRGFTNISEYFKKRDDPAGLVRMVNRLLDELTIPLIAHKGTLDKYMGDCIMGFWNAPLPVPDHARHACRAGLAMMELVAPLNVQLAKEAEERGEKFETPLKVGLGFNSGEVIVGDMGSSMQSGYSVLGDAVNLASRLEGQCKTYVVDCVIGEETHIRAPDFAMLELDLIKVKGKSEPVRIFVLLGDDEAAKTPEFLALKESHDGLIAAYREQRWDDARRHIGECRERLGDFNMAGFYDVFEVRIDTFEKNPPGADWDGVFVATSK